MKEIKCKNLEQLKRDSAGKEITKRRPTSQVGE
jgi:hypothetical protein